MKNINTSADQQQPTTQVKSGPGPKSSRHIMRRQSTSINEYQQLDDDFYDNNSNNRNEDEEGGDEDDEDEEDGDSALFNRGRRRRMMIKASVSSTSLLNTKIGHKNTNFAATVASANQKFRVVSVLIDIFNSAVKIPNFVTKIMKALKSLVSILPILFISIISYYQKNS